MKFHVPQNCIQIKTNKVPDIPTNRNDHVFIPGIILSNVMSLSPKIDEMRPFVHNSGADIAAFTETWLKDSILDTVVDIPGYNIVRKDRVTRIHGGVCIYIRNQVKFTILHNELHNPSFEVLWIKLQPKRLLRGITGIIIGTIYHPPCSDDQSRNDYLINSLTSIEALNINCGIILINGRFKQVENLTY